MLSASSTGSMVLSLCEDGKYLKQNCSFSILYRIDGFVTGERVRGDERGSVLSASSTGSMVLSLGCPHRSAFCVASFSILYRIDGFVTRTPRTPSRRCRTFQHPLPDRWFCHLLAGLAPGGQAVFLSASSTGSMVLSRLSAQWQAGALAFQHPLPDRWFCHQDGIDFLHVAWVAFSIL